MTKTLLKALCCTVLLSFSLAAREPYHAHVTVNTDSVSLNAPNLLDLSRELKTTSLQVLAPLYTPTSAIALDINLRGILAETSFAVNSTTLIVDLPQAGISTSFNGGTRDQSLELFRQYIRDGGHRHRLLRAYAKYSSIDPIAGNTNSLMAQMGEADYQLGKLSPLAGCCYSIQPVVHQFQTGLNAGRTFSKGFDTSIVTLPLRYSYCPRGDFAIILDAPFTYNRNGGASSVFGSLGVALRLPVTERWSLTSMFRAGSGGSLDLCTSGSFVSAAILSHFDHKIQNFVLSMTNYVGYFSTTNLWLTGINYNYKLQNYIIKNGVSITSCEFYKFCDRPINFSLSFIDSYFTSNKLYINHYDEIGISLISTHINPRIDYDCASIGFAYQFGKKSYKGYCIKLLYQF
jgi:hypothetical protein